MGDIEFRRWWDKAGNLLASLVLAALIGICGHIWGRIDAAETKIHALEKVDAVKDEKFLQIKVLLEELKTDVKKLNEKR